MRGFRLHYPLHTTSILLDCVQVADILFKKTWREVMLELRIIQRSLARRAAGGLVVGEENESLKPV